MRLSAARPRFKRPHTLEPAWGGEGESSRIRAGQVLRRANPAAGSHHRASVSRLISAARSSAVHAERVTPALDASRYRLSGPVPATVQRASIFQSGWSWPNCANPANARRAWSEALPGIGAGHRSAGTSSTSTDAVTRKRVRIPVVSSTLSHAVCKHVVSRKGRDHVTSATGSGCARLRRQASTRSPHGWASPGGGTPSSVRGVRTVLASQVMQTGPEWTPKHGLER